MSRREEREREGLVRREEWEDLSIGRMLRVNVGRCAQGEEVTMCLYGKKKRERHGDRSRMSYGSLRRKGKGKEGRGRTVVVVII